MIGKDRNREAGQPGGSEENRQQGGRRNAVLVGMAACGLGNWVGGRGKGVRRENGDSGRGVWNPGDWEAEVFAE